MEEVIIVVFASFQVGAQNSEESGEDKTLEKGLEILKRYFYQDNSWYIAKPSLAKDVQGLINFIENVFSLFSPLIHRTFPA